jgi:hypothetical protein
MAKQKLAFGVYVVSRYPRLWQVVSIQGLPSSILTFEPLGITEEKEYQPVFLDSLQQVLKSIGERCRQMLIRLFLYLFSGLTGSRSRLIRLGLPFPPAIVNRFR